MKKLATLIIAVAMAVTASLSLCACDAEQSIKGNTTESWNGYKKESFYLNTLCDITIYRIDRKKAFSSGDDGEQAKLTDEELNEKYDEIIAGCFKMISNYENLLSKTVEGSDIYRINKAEGRPTQVDRETFEVIKKGIEFGELSDGMFDITIGKASDLWNFSGDDEDIEPAEEISIPSKEELDKAVTHIDYTKISLDDNTGYIKLRDPKMEIDLGGIAKGYIADRAADFLRDKGVVSGVVNLGGNIVAIGGKAQSEDYAEDVTDDTIDFNLGIINPAVENAELLGAIQARDITIVTSGTYERFVEKDGVRYHHILDPKTGFPIDNGLMQVSIIAEKGHSADCDGLSTACLALGTEKGTALIERLNSSGKYGKIEAIFLDNLGNVSFTNPETAFTLSRKN